MASFKQVTLKDPVTGEYLSPRVYGALEYEVVEDGTVVSPYDMNADTLQGHPASDFLLKSEYTPVDLSEYLKTATADTKYAAVSHTHTTGQISDLSTALAGYAPASHTHTTANITGLDTKLSGYDTEIASLKSSVSEGKSLVAAAVTDKGVTTAADAAFQTIANNIGKISTGYNVQKVELYPTVTGNNDDDRVSTITINCNFAPKHYVGFCTEDADSSSTYDIAPISIFIDGKGYYEGMTLYDDDRAPLTFTVSGNRLTIKHTANGLVFGFRDKKHIFVLWG